MKIKNGFTLIELLAVIVILAIIALIATPIVLNIISDAKSESGLRSADFYLDALELSIAQATLKGQNITDDTYDILSNGNLCLKYDADNKCTEELEVEVKGKVPSGTIGILNGQIDAVSLILDNKEIYKNSKGELVYVKTLDEVCELKSGTAKERSSKYECKVDPNKAPYTFYVLSYLDQEGNIVTDKTNAKSVNLIMDSNIRTGGEPVKEANPTAAQNGIVAWINQGDYESVGGQKWDDWTDKNTFGPITAMNFLSEATKSWTNTNEIKTSTIEYENGTTYTMAKTYTTNARMPYYSEVESVSSDKVWLINYLYGDEDADYGIEGRTGVSDVYGYWTLSPDAEESDVAWTVYFDGTVGYDGVDIASYYGVRPVINLKI